MIGGVDQVFKFFSMLCLSGHLLSLWGSWLVLWLLWSILPLRTLLDGRCLWWESLFWKKGESFLSLLFMGFLSAHEVFDWLTVRLRWIDFLICRYFTGFAYFTGANLALTLVAAALCVQFAPTAAGPGIPEIKAYLNGVDTPNMFGVPTLIVKVRCFFVQSILIYVLWTLQPCLVLTVWLSLFNQ